MSQSFTTRVFTCEFCQNTYGSKRSLVRHQRNCGPFIKRFDCEICSKSFRHRHHLKRHEKTYHLNDRDSLTCLTCHITLSNFEAYRKHISSCSPGTSQSTSSNVQTFKCCTCQKSFASTKTLAQHTKSIHLKRPSRPSQQGGGVSKRKRPNEAPQGCSRQAINGQVREYDFNPEGQEGLDPFYYLVKIQPEVTQHLKQEIESKHSIKWRLCCQFKFSKMGPDGQQIYTEPYFSTKMTQATAADDLDTIYTEAINKIMKDMDNFEGDSSNLNFEKVVNVKLSIVKFQPFRGSSYLPLPPALENKRSLLNIHNMDEKCILYCTLAHLYSVGSDLVREQVGHYTPHMHKLDVRGCHFPMSLKDINNFEKLNNLSINVYGFGETSENDDEETENVVFPLRVSTTMGQVPKERHIDLLLLTSDVEEEDVPSLSHYVLITNLVGLVRQPNDHNSKFICRKCLWTFTSEERLQKHKPYCYHRAQRIQMPEPEKAQRKFGLGHYCKTVRVPFVVYADFECILSPLSEEQDAGKHVSRIQHHIPCGYSYQIVCREPSLYSFNLKTFSGENAAQHFMETLLEDYENIMNILNNPVPMLLTDMDKLAIDSTTTCYLFGGEVEVHERHIDHDHLTGEFRGMCHSYCNVNYQETKFVPVVCHNASRYDNHLILQAAELFSDRKLKCIPHNTEHFLMVEIDHLRFLDSFKFLNASLQTLANNLRNKGQGQFVQLAHKYPDHVELLTRKLPYFYEYVDSFEKLNETEFPSRDDFYSSLSEDTVSEEDYQFARHIWGTFQIQSVREFMELYVSIDTLILADVMEAFRTMCLQNYKLDPFQYFTLPGMAMDACLLMTGISLDLFIEPDMYNFVEQGVRGGVASINHRHASANNKYMHDFDPLKPESYLMYFDINNLYGAAMSSHLPQGNFEWVEEDQIDQIDWLNLDPEGDKGYILDCDLIYPRNLHSVHQSLPLAPSKESIPYEAFSDYHKNLLLQLEIKGEKPTGTKLFSTLRDKTHYMIHFSTLQLYLCLGLKLDKIHKVLKISQSKWMKPYIDFNTQKRKEATDDFSKDFWKLCSNAVYGKLLQNVRNYQQVELITTNERLRRYTSKTYFKSVKIFSEHLVAVSMEKVMVTLNQPVSVGFAILEHAKRILYEFHYDVMIREYGSDHIRVLMTDTDSLFYQIWSPVGTPLRDPYDFMKANIVPFDTSNYPRDHQLHSMDRHKAIGVMKDEISGQIIREFVGLRAKNYSFIYDKAPGDIGEKRTAKGIQRNFVKKHMRHDMYKDCLFNQEQSIASYHQIRSFHNQLYTIKLTKLALTPMDDKRRLSSDGIESRPYGFNPL